MAADNSITEVQMSGYSSTLFLEELSRDFECSICLQVLNDPRQCPDNGHMFCFSCILRQLQSAKKCPECRCPLLPSTLVENKPVKRIIGKMKTRCPTTDETGISDGEDFCDWIGPLDDHVRHMAHDCGFVGSTCIHEGCHASIHRRKSAAHDECCDHKLIPCDYCSLIAKRVDQRQHGLVCPRKPITCPLDCGQAIARANMDQHAAECPHALVRCGNEGCEESIQRRLQDIHDDSCAHKIVPCLLCGMTMKRLSQPEHESVCPKATIACSVGCKDMVPRDEMENHFTRCPLVITTCPNQGCQRAMARRELQVHDEECPHKMSPCCLCSHFMKRADVEEHQQRRCTRRPTQCPNSCRALVPLEDMECHLAECPLQEVECPHHSAFGCSPACPVRILRRDIEEHSMDPRTLAAVMTQLSTQAARGNFVVTWPKAPSTLTLTPTVVPATAGPPEYALGRGQEGRCQTGRIEHDREDAGPITVFDLVRQAAEDRQIIATQAEYITSLTQQVEDSMRAMTHRDQAIAEAAEAISSLRRRVAQLEAGRLLLSAASDWDTPLPPSGLPSCPSEALVLGQSPSSASSATSTLANAAPIKAKKGGSNSKSPDRVIDAFPNVTAQWSAPPCDSSKGALAQQLRKRKSSWFERWTTHHIAHEFQSEEFLDPSTLFVMESPRVDFGSGVSGCITIKRKLAGYMACGVYLTAFRGAAEVTLTAFRFNHGAPKAFNFSLKWTVDEAKGFPNFFTTDELLSEGWLADDSKLRFLLTVHLKRS